MRYKFELRLQIETMDANVWNVNPIETETLMVKEFAANTIKDGAQFISDYIYGGMFPYADSDMFAAYCAARALVLESNESNPMETPRDEHGRAKYLKTRTNPRRVSVHAYRILRDSEQHERNYTQAFDHSLRTRACATDGAETNLSYINLRVIPIAEQTERVNTYLRGLLSISNTLNAETETAQIEIPHEQTDTPNETVINKETNAVNTNTNTYALTLTINAAHVETVSRYMRADQINIIETVTHSWVFNERTLKANIARAESFMYGESDSVFGDAIIAANDGLNESEFLTVKLTRANGSEYGETSTYYTQTVKEMYLNPFDAVMYLETRNKLRSDVSEYINELIGLYPTETARDSSTLANDVILNCVTRIVSREYVTNPNRYSKFRAHVETLVHAARRANLEYANTITRIDSMVSDTEREFVHESITRRIMANPDVDTMDLALAMNGFVTETIGALDSAYGINSWAYRQIEIVRANLTACISKYANEPVNESLSETAQIILPFADRRSNSYAYGVDYNAILNVITETEFAMVMDALNAWFDAEFTTETESTRRILKAFSGLFRTRVWLIDNLIPNVLNTTTDAVRVHFDTFAPFIETWMVARAVARQTDNTPNPNAEVADANDYEIVSFESFDANTETVSVSGLYNDLSVYLESPWVDSNSPMFAYGVDVSGLVDVVINADDFAVMMNRINTWYESEYIITNYSPLNHNYMARVHALDVLIFQIIPSVINISHATLETRYTDFEMFLNAWIDNRANFIHTNAMIETDVYSPRDSFEILSDADSADDSDDSNDPNDPDDSNPHGAPSTQTALASSEMDANAVTDQTVPETRADAVYTETRARTLAGEPETIAFPHAESIAAIVFDMYTANPNDYAMNIARMVINEIKRREILNAQEFEYLNVSHVINAVRFMRDSYADDSNALKHSYTLPCARMLRDEYIYKLNVIADDSDYTPQDIADFLRRTPMDVRRAYADYNDSRSFANFVKSRDTVGEYVIHTLNGANADMLSILETLSVCRTNELRYGPSVTDSRTLSEIIIDSFAANAVLTEQQTTRAVDDLRVSIEPVRDDSGEPAIPVADTTPNALESNTDGVHGVHAEPLTEPVSASANASTIRRIIDGEHVGNDGLTPPERKRLVPAIIRANDANVPLDTRRILSDERIAEINEYRRIANLETPQTETEQTEQTETPRRTAFESRAFRDGLRAGFESEQSRAERETRETARRNNRTEHELHTRMHAIGAPLGIDDNRIEINTDYSRRIITKPANVRAQNLITNHHVSRFAQMEYDINTRSYLSDSRDIDTHFVHVYIQIAIGINEFWYGNRIVSELEYNAAQLTAWTFGETDIGNDMRAQTRMLAQDDYRFRSDFADGVRFEPETITANMIRYARVFNTERIHDVYNDGSNAGLYYRFRLEHSIKYTDGNGLAFDTYSAYAKYCDIRAAYDLSAH